MSTKKESMYITVARDLQRRMTRGEWPIGSYWPSRTALRHEYAWVNDGTPPSGAVIADAQAQLEALGLIEPQQGAGVKVVALPAPDTEPVVAPAFGTRPLAVVHLRNPLRLGIFQAADTDTDLGLREVVYCTPGWDRLDELGLSILHSSADEDPDPDSKLDWEGARSVVAGFRDLVDPTADHTGDRPLPGILSAPDEQGASVNTLSEVHVFADSIDITIPAWVEFTARVVRIALEVASIEASTYRADPGRYLLTRAQRIIVPSSEVTSITYLPA